MAAYKVSDPDGRVADISPSVDAESMNCAQPFQLCKGTRLIGANGDTRGITNGAFLTVHEVREEDCTVTDEGVLASI